MIASEDDVTTYEWGLTIMHWVRRLVAYARAEESVFRTVWRSWKRSEFVGSQTILARVCDRLDALLFVESLVSLCPAVFCSPGYVQHFS